MMNAVDYIIVAAVALSALIGLMRGFLREIIALLTWLTALLAAWHFAALLEPYLGGALADAHWRPWAARALIVVFVLLVGSAFGHVLTHFVRLSIFSGMDRLLGFVFGAVRGGVVLGIFVMLGQTLQLTTEAWWRHSLLIPYGVRVANGLRAVLGEERVRHITAGAEEV